MDQATCAEVLAVPVKQHGLIFMWQVQLGRGCSGYKIISEKFKMGHKETTCKFRSHLLVLAQVCVFFYTANKEENFILFTQ